MVSADLRHAVEAVPLRSLEDGQPARSHNLTTLRERCQNKRMPKIIGESLASHRELTRARLFEALGVLMGEAVLRGVSITMSQIARRAGVGRAAFCEG